MKVHLIGGCRNGDVVEIANWLREVRFNKPRDLPLVNSSAPIKDVYLAQDNYIISEHVICGVLYHFGIPEAVLRNTDKPPTKIVMEKLIDNYFTQK